MKDNRKIRTFYRIIEKNFRKTLKVYMNPAEHDFNWNVFECKGFILASSLMILIIWSC